MQVLPVLADGEHVFVHAVTSIWQRWDMPCAVVLAVYIAYEGLELLAGAVRRLVHEYDRHIAATIRGVIGSPCDR